MSIRPRSRRALRVIAIAATLTAGVTVSTSAHAAAPRPLFGQTIPDGATRWRVEVHPRYSECLAGRDLATKGILPANVTECELFTNGGWGFYAENGAKWKGNTFTTLTECREFSRNMMAGIVPTYVTKCQLSKNFTWGMYTVPVAIDHAR